MKAAVLYGKEDLRIETDFEEPAIGENDVLLRPQATGLCSTDRTLYRGFVPFRPPLILGHEIAGVVAEVGSAVDSLSVGDHAIVPPVYPGCEDESCPQCREGITNRCRQSVFIGHGVHGGDAEMMAVPARYAFPIDPSVPLDEACIIPDAVSTPFHALRSRAVPTHLLQRDRGALTARETHWLRGRNVVVLGVGGVGGPTVNLAARYFGAKNVVAVDVVDDKLEFARRLGATHTVNSMAYFEDAGVDLKALDAKERGKAMSGLAKHISSQLEEDRFQVDLVADTSGVADTFPVAVETVSKNRTVIQIGWPPKPVAGFLNQKIMDKYLTINGTWACPMTEMAEVVKAVEDGTVDLDRLVTNKEFDLDSIVSAIEALEAGKVLGRASIRIE